MSLGQMSHWTLQSGRSATENKALRGKLTLRFSLPFTVTLKWSMSFPLARPWAMTSMPAFPGLLAMAVGCSSIEKTSNIHAGNSVVSMCTGVGEKLGDTSSLQ